MADNTPMAFLQLFSKRYLATANPDPFRYDSLPEALRVQIIHIWRDALGTPDPYVSKTDQAWGEIHRSLAREFGRFTLASAQHQTDIQAVSTYFLKSASILEILDIIELVFQSISLYGSSDYYRSVSRCAATPWEAIDELNQRFRQHEIGYEFISGQIIRKDYEMLHKQVVLPALTLISDPRFAGPNEEYLLAHEHYRHSRYKESLNECLKAFESVMKTICKLKGWTFSDKDTAKTLIDICLGHNLVPSFLQSEVSAIRSVLESGIPTVRNRLSGHGQGPEPVEVPSYYASYLLNITGATIILFVEASGLKL